MSCYCFNATLFVSVVLFCPIFEKDTFIKHLYIVNNIFIEQCPNPGGAVVKSGLRLVGIWFKAQYRPTQSRFLMTQCKCVRPLHPLLSPIELFLVPASAPRLV